MSTPIQENLPIPIDLSGYASAQGQAEGGGERHPLEDEPRCVSIALRFRREPWAGAPPQRLDPEAGSHDTTTDAAAACHRNEESGSGWAVPPTSKPAAIIPPRAACDEDVCR